MGSNKVKGFFYPGNAVSGEPYYGLADFFVRSDEAFANLLISPFSLAVRFGSSPRVLNTTANSLPEYILPILR